MPTAARWWFAAALLIPRIARLVYGAIWVEDEAYLEVAAAISRGQLPYHDIPLPHHCLLDGLLGGLFWLFGPSVLLAELVNNLAIWVAALVLWRSLASEDKPLLAPVAAAVLSLAPLLMRYHVWEREVFSLLCMVIAVRLLLRQSRPLWLALVLALAILVKLTNVLFLAVVALYLGIVRRDYRLALATAATGFAVAAAVIAATGLFVGPELFQQMVLVHLLKGRALELSVRLGWLRQGLDLVLVIGLPGLLWLWTRARPLGALATLWLGVYLVFYLLISPTLWTHNLIDMLVPLCLGGAGTVAFLHEALHQAARWTRREASALIALLVWLAVGGIWVAPLELKRYALRPRSEIARVAEVVRRCSRPGETIVAPALIAVAADRPKLVVYREIAALLPQARRRWKAEGWSSLVRAPADRGFYRRSGQGALGPSGWRLRVQGAVEQRRVAVLVNDTGRGHFPIYVADAGWLAKNGLTRVYRSRHYEVWTAPTRATPPSRGPGGVAP